MKTFCRKCLLADLDDKELASLIREAILSVPEAERVPDNVYQARLLKCRNCEMLLNGTCLRSGYFAEVRAVRKQASCKMWEN